MEQNAVIKNKKSIYIVWVIPFVAMLLAGWMIFKHFDEQGLDIVITFDSGDGLAVDKTPLMYNGMKIGQITDIHANNNDFTKVDATITIEKRALLAAKRGNVFWKVEPKVSLTEISGLSTILSGVYIGVMIPHKDKLKLTNLPNQTHFTALPAPPVDLFDPGLRFTLHADNSDVRQGAPILFRNITVGEVEEVVLTKNGVDYSIHIQNKYANLIKQNTQFWQLSGLEVKASLAGIRVSMNSLASVITGGISFNSPEDGEKIKEGHEGFVLFGSEDETKLAKDTITLISQHGHKIDAKSSFIYFKGIEAGIVEKVSYDPKSENTTFIIKLNKDFRYLANEDAYFWIVEPHLGLTEVKGLDAIARGPYITFSTTSKSTVLTHQFDLNSEPPLIKGTSIRLHAGKAYNLKSGVNVVFNDLIIGTLSNSYISKSTHEVLFDIIIYDEYKKLVNETSSFYLQGAIEGEINLQGMYFNVGSLSSMLHSGIALVTEDLTNSIPKSSFQLLDSYKTYEDKRYLEDGGEIYQVSCEDLASVQVDSPIIYKGINVGKVISYKLNQKTDLITLEIYIKGEYLKSINASTRFYNMSGIEVKADMKGLKLQTGSLESILAGGIGFQTPMKINKDEMPEQFHLFKNRDDAQDSYVKVFFNTAKESGLKAGSKIIYKTIDIGQITEVNLVNDTLLFMALIDDKYSNILAEDSKFWIEDFEFNIDKVKNPAAILTGAFLKTAKGRSPIKATHFTILENPPADTINKEGLRIVVKGERLSSLKIGAPIFYRQIKIGSLEYYKLSNDSTGVEMRLFIDPKYKYLVRRNSIFYNATAIGMDVNVFGVKLSTETLATMIHGGITMVVPDKPLGLAREMERYILHAEADDDWLDYQPILIKDNAIYK